jgi:regulator of sigma E protease
MKHGIVAYPLGKDVGFQSGDQILKVNGKAVTKMDEAVDNRLILDKGLSYTVLRNGAEVNITLPDNFGKRIIDSGGASQFIGVRHTFLINEVSGNSPAIKAGLKENDRVIAVNGNTEAKFFDVFTDILHNNKNKVIDLQVLRGTDTVLLKPKVESDGKIGFSAMPEIKFDAEYFGLGQSMVIGNSKAWKTISDNVKALGRIITNDIPANKSLNSFIGIAKAYGGTWNWNSFWQLTGMLSMVLALMNFLPIPALDGGYVIFLLVEAIMGRPVSYKVLERAQTVGFSLLLALMAFALFNDITRFVIK